MSTETGTRRPTVEKSRSGRVYGFGPTEFKRGVDEQLATEVCEPDVSPIAVVSPSIESMISACRRTWRCRTERLTASPSSFGALCSRTTPSQRSTETPTRSNEFVRKAGGSERGERRMPPSLYAAHREARQPEGSKAVSEYAAMLRFARAENISVEGFSAFATEKTLREAAAATC